MLFIAFFSKGLSLREEISLTNENLFKYSSKDRIKVDLTQSQNSLSISKRLNGFGLNLFKAILSDSQNQNLFVSPFSLSIGTLMVYFGARGETAKQLKKLLGLNGLSTDDILKLNRDQIIDLNLNDEYGLFYLKSSNKLFLNQSTIIPFAYEKVLKEYFRIDLERVNFKDTFNSANAINDWVRHETNGTISKLLEPSELNEETKMVIVNAIYLKALWFNPFQIKDTVKEDFKLTNGETIKVDMMKKFETRLNYFSNPGGLRAKAVNLWFMMGTASLTIILPEPDVDIKEIENSLSIDVVNYLMFNTESYSSVNLSLPKFKVEFESEVIFFSFFLKKNSI